MIRFDGRMAGNISPYACTPVHYVLLPLYLDGLALFEVRAWPWLIAFYMLAMAVLLVSTIPTFSGKLLGERISGDYVLPVFVGAAAGAALLVTYPYGTLAIATLAYLGTIPISYRRFERKLYDPFANRWCGNDSIPRRDSQETPATNQH